MGQTAKLLRWAVKKSRHDEAGHASTYLEFGVRHGKSFVWTAQRIGDTDELIGFDSWQGLPEETEGVYKLDRHTVGRYACRKTMVEGKLVKEFGRIPRNVRFVDGFFSDTLTPLLAATITRSVVFVNFDCDLHVSTLQALEFCTDLLRFDALLYFDDWHEHENNGKPYGQKLAFLQWVEKNGIKHETLREEEMGRRVIQFKGFEPWVIRNL